MSFETKQAAITRKGREFFSGLGGPIRSKAAAIKITGSLGKPSKMPGLSYGISAALCKVGAALAKIEGSTCAGCYALKANYQYPSVKAAHAKRAAGLDHPQWTEAMVYLIGSSGETFFRWHDSGDLQSFQHLLNIVKVAEALPAVSFWLPTREKALVLQYQRSFGSFPANLVVRVSAAMIDSAAPAGFQHTSTVHARAAAQGYSCPAQQQGNKCQDCRACWDASVSNVSYHQH
jgi:hypothetical protein